MIVIACLDDNGGMMFNHRRQSQDRVLRAHIAALVGGAMLWMNHYSAQQFDAESIQHLNVDDAFLQEAVQGDYCFVEDTALKSYERWIERSLSSGGTELTLLISPLTLISVGETGN